MLISLIWAVLAVIFILFIGAVFLVRATAEECADHEAGAVEGAWKDE